MRQEPVAVLQYFTLSGRALRIFNCDPVIYKYGKYYHYMENTN